MKYHTLLATFLVTTIATGCATQDMARDVAAHRTRRVIFNNDGDDAIHYGKFQADGTPVSAITTLLLEPTAEPAPSRTVTLPPRAASCALAAVTEMSMANTKVRPIVIWNFRRVNIPPPVSGKLCSDTSTCGSIPLPNASVKLGRVYRPAHVRAPSRQAGGAHYNTSSHRYIGLMVVNWVEFGPRGLRAGNARCFMVSGLR